MKRALFILCMLAASAVISFAQEEQQKAEPSESEKEKKEIRRYFEIGAGYNLITVYDSRRNTSAKGPGAYFEYRESISDHVVWGGQINYKYGRGEGYDYSKVPEGELTGVICHQVGMKGVVDCNIIPDKEVTPYVGVGIGLSLVIGTRSNYSQMAYFYQTFGLRGGVQIDHLRIGLEFDINCSWSKRARYNYLYGSLLALNAAITF